MDQQPWEWPDDEWQRRVGQVRAGRSLKPATWPGGARSAVALSFDSDHDTNELRDGGISIGRMSWGQYGTRVGIPRILQILKREQIPASFFVPAVAAKLYPDEQRRVIAEPGYRIGEVDRRPDAEHRRLPPRRALPEPHIEQRRFAARVGADQQHDIGAFDPRQARIQQIGAARRHIEIGAVLPALDALAAEPLQHGELWRACERQRRELRRACGKQHREAARRLSPGW